MNNTHKTREELTLELEKLQKEYESLTSSFQSFKDKCDRSIIELHKSEKIHRSLFEISFQGIVYQNSEGQILDANPAAQKILGLTLDQMQGRTSYDPRWRAIKEDGTNFAGEEHPALISLKTGKIIKNTMMGVYNPVDEKLHWILINASPLFNEGEDSPYMVYTVFDDVTEHKEFAEALKESKANMSAMINSSVQLIILLSTDETILEMNSTAVKRLGRPREAMIGKKVFDLLPPEVVSFRRPFIQRAISSGKQVTFEDRRDDRWMINNLYPVLDDNGKVVRLAVYSYDITEQKKANELLLESEERYRLLAENATDFIWVFDLDTNSFKYQSPSVERLLGYTPDELQEFGFFNTFAGQSKEIILSVINERIELFRNGQTGFFIDIAEQVHKNGSTVWVEINSQIKLNPQTNHIEATGVARNITERKRAEESLRESEEKYHNLFDIESDALFMLEKSTVKLEEVNNAAVRLYGYSREELLAMNAFELSAEPAKSGQTLSDNSGIVPIRYHRKKDGTIFPVEITYSDFVYLGRLMRIAAVREITERKTAEEKLLQIHQNYESFFNTVDEFLFVLDEQGNIIHTNTAVIHRLGYTFDELAGKSVLLLHPPERREEAGKIVGEMLMGITAFCPVPVITKSGIQIPVETRVKHGVWDGKPVIFGVSKDISNLKLSEEKFSKLFHINPSACGLSDLSNHQYLEVNEAFCNLFGFDKDEVIGKTATELNILSQESIKTIMLSANKHGNINNAEADLRAKNGSIKHTLLSSENIFVQDKKYRFTVVNDITDRIISEKALKKSEEELRQLNATKDKFFSIIAHDLKSPFNSIVGFSELLVDKIKENDNTGIGKYAGIILNSSQRAVDLLMNLMEWSRSQTGRIQFCPMHFDMVDFIKENTILFNEIAMQKMIPIKLDLPPHSPVYADKAMICTVLRNLISNAIKFTKPGGEIIISATQNQTELVVSVSDNGVGISKSNIQKLFRIDENYTTSGTNKERGTGLGLILCKEFVEKHGGKIWVESVLENQLETQPGGSTFFFTIPEKPLTQVKKETQEEPSSAAIHQQTNCDPPELKILIVEDDKPSELLMNLAVKLISNEIITVSSGIAAIEACHKNPDFDLILMDINLPGMDGLEITQQIRQFNKQVVIIAQSALALGGIREKAFAAGCNDFLSKPFKKEALLALIQKHFR